METVFLVMDSITHFIFNWTTYFWSIPVWFVFWMLFVKKLGGEKITVADLPMFFIISLMNPLWYLLVGILVALIPFIYLFVWLDDIFWSKIKNKELF